MNTEIFAQHDQIVGDCFVPSRFQRGESKTRKYFFVGPPTWARNIPSCIARQLITATDLYRLHCTVSNEWPAEEAGWVIPSDPHSRLCFFWHPPPPKFYWKPNLVPRVCPFAGYVLGMRTGIFWVRDCWKPWSSNEPHTVIELKHILKKSNDLRTW